MKAVRLHEFHTQPVIDDVPDPKISGPFDVIVTTVPPASFTDNLFKSTDQSGVGLSQPLFWAQNFVPTDFACK